LLCEQTIVEAVTGKISIVNMFNSFVVGKYPSATRRFSVFLQLTDCRNESQVTIEVHDLREDEVVARSPAMTVQSPEKLYVVNVIIPCPPIGVHHGGAYDLVVFADGQEIDRQQFHVRSSEDNEDEEQENDDDDDSE